MDRTTNQYTITPATGLIPADVAKKASELGLLPQLHEYSKMNAQRRREVYQQVLSLAKALGTSTDNVKASLQLDVIFDPDEVRQQQSAAAERAAAAAAATAQRAAAAAAATAQRASAAAAATAQRAARSDAGHAYSPYGVYGISAATFAQRAAALNVVITCRYYIDELDKVEEELDKVEEELERVKEENARLEKENATLVELLPGRGGSRKRKAMRGSTRRKRH
jgi:uncharacterized membrane protein